MKYLELSSFLYMLTVGVIGPKKLVNDVLHFFCTLSNRRNTVHLSYVPSVLELELCMGWKCTSCFVAMNLDLSSYNYVHLLKAFCYIEAVKSCLPSAFPFNFFFVPLLRGQPLLSGHSVSKSRGWPLNRGRTVYPYKSVLF